MITHKLIKLPKNTYLINVTIPWKEVEAEYASAFEAVREDFEMKGYRKGKVPAAIAEKNISKETVYQQLIRAFMPKVYEKILKEEKLTPAVSPRIDLKKAKEDEDWEIEFKLAERPTVKLNNYKEAVKKVKADTQKADIWVPGKEKPTPEKEAAAKTEADQKVLNSALDAVMKEAEVDISELIIEEELNQRLTRLVDDIQRLGLTTETYLKSKNMTMEDLKKQYAKELEDMYKIEFILMEIAEQEKIAVEQTDLEKMFSAITDEKERMEVQKNAYYYASILRKQKTLDFLTSL